MDRAAICVGLRLDVDHGHLDCLVAGQEFGGGRGGWRSALCEEVSAKSEEQEAAGEAAGKLCVFHVEKILVIKKKEGIVVSQGKSGLPKRRYQLFEKKQVSLWLGGIRVENSKLS